MSTWQLGRQNTSPQASAQNSRAFIAAQTGWPNVYPVGSLAQAAARAATNPAVFSTLAGAELARV